jgi:F-type H+-transporting ATPase subunit gamma
VSNTLASLRHQRDGAEKLGAVVRAMKAAAASSIGQYEAAVRALAGYERSVELGLSVCLRGAPVTAGTSGRSGDPRIGAIVFGSDQGLVGRFNEVIVNFAEQSLDALPGQKRLWAVGERVSPHLSAAGLPILGQLTVPSSVAAITPLVTQIQVEIEAYCAQDANTEIHVFHNRPQSAARYEPFAQRLLPLDDEWRRRLSALPWPNGNVAQALGDGEVALRALVREYLFISLYKACAESLASEHSSRLAAMQRAQKNIASRSAHLRQLFNRLRQSSIDEELFDVIAGFNTLSPESQSPKRELP